MKPNYDLPRSVVEAIAPAHTRSISLGYGTHPYLSQPAGRSMASPLLTRKFADASVVVRKEPKIFAFGLRWANLRA